MDSCTILCPSAEKMRFTGVSLAQTLYSRPLTIGLQGPMGSGKTTFTQGFGEGLGVRDSITSPTFALEQRYKTPRGLLIHLDLYRLTAAQAKEVLRASDDEDGIRVVEWSERSESKTLDPGILLTFADHEQGRSVTAEFRDIELPSLAQIREWQEELLLPEHVVRHCEAVMRATELLSEHLLKNGRLVRPALAKTAALVHDLFRFLDFRPEGHRSEFATNSPVQQKLWQPWRERYPLSHEAACAAFLREEGYDALASVVATHGVKESPGANATTEQRLVYYADKRIMEEKPVTLDERYADFRTRYNDGKPPTKEQSLWLQQSKDCEKQLFPEGAPLLW